MSKFQTYFYTYWTETTEILVRGENFQTGTSNFFWEGRQQAKTINCSFWGGRFLITDEGCCCSSLAPNIYYAEEMLWSGVQSVLRAYFTTLWTYFAQNSNISSRFQKWGATASQVCRTAIIRPALESSDPDASNGGSNVGVWLFGADLIAFEIAELTK